MTGELSKPSIDEVVWAFILRSLVFYLCNCRPAYAHKVSEIAERFRQRAWCFLTQELLANSACWDLMYEMLILVNEANKVLRRRRRKLRSGS